MPSRRLTRNLIVLSLLVLKSAVTVYAQAEIDPNLPAGSEPLLNRRVLGVFANTGIVPSGKAVAPLSAGQKFQIFSVQTFQISTPLIAAFTAGISHANDNSPNYGQGGEAFAKRFGAQSANLTSGRFFSTAALPILLRQDPRYFQKKTGSVRSRILYAATRAFVTRTDRGNWTFNSSLVGGIAASVALSNAYLPDQNRNVRQNAQRFGIGIGSSALLNVLREFTANRATN